MKGQIK